MQQRNYCNIKITEDSIEPKKSKRFYIEDSESSTKKAKDNINDFMIIVNFIFK